MERLTPIEAACHADLLAIIAVDRVFYRRSPTVDGDRAQRSKPALDHRHRPDVAHEAASAPITVRENP